MIKINTIKIDGVKTRFARTWFLLEDPVYRVNQTNLLAILAYLRVKLFVLCESINVFEGVKPGKPSFQ